MNGRQDSRRTMQQTTNIGALVIALTSLVCMTVLGVLGDVSSDAVVAVFTAALAGSVGHATGFRAGVLEATNGEAEKR